MTTTSHNKKRNLTENMPTEESHKRIKNAHKGGIFTEDGIPEEMFHIGDSIFVYPNTFRGNVLVHIRRFTKYGSTFYPTKEGVTLYPGWIEFIMKPGALPQEPRDLRGSFFLPEDEFKVDSVDFENFTFTRFQTTQCGDTFKKSITISSSQWTEMKQQYNFIAASVLDHVYGAMDLLSAYKTFEQCVNIDESLPDSLDVSLGTQCLIELLKDSLSHCLKERGLKEPELLSEELWANRVESFNSAAFSLEVTEIVDSFYHRLWEHKDFLCLSKPAMYVTSQFLKDIRLKDVLREVRNVLCPPYTFEYFDDCN